MYGLSVLPENIINEQEIKSLNTSASSIKYVANKESVINKVFVANQVFIGNYVFVWKISWQYFGLGHFSGITYLKDQRTLVWLGPIKYLSERSINNTLASHIWKIKGHYFCMASQVYFGSGWSSIYLKDQLSILWLEKNQKILSADQIIQKMFFFSRFFFRKKITSRLDQLLISKSSR